MAKLLPGQLTPLVPIRPLPDLSRTRTRTIKPNIPINTKKTTNKELEDADNILAEYVKKVCTGPGAGERFAILAKESEIEYDYNNINMLNDKLNNNDLNFAQYKKISDNIDQIRKNIPKKEQKLYELKKDLEKRTRTDQSKFFKDQNKELSGPYIDERFNINLKKMLLKNDYNDISTLNDRLKDNNLTSAENKKIHDDINQIKKNILRREQKIYEFKKDLEKKIRTNQARSFKDQNK